MPFNKREVVIPQGVAVPPILSRHDHPDPTFMETTGAAFGLENIIGSAMVERAYRIEDEDEVTPGFNTFERAESAGLGSYVDDGRFDDVFNERAFNAREAQIREEERKHQIIAASGWTGTALMFGASVADPTILMPGGALVKGLRAGYSVRRSAAAVGAAAATATAVQEAALHSTQQTRTNLETSVAIGGSAILGGLLGGTLGAVLSKGEWSRISKAIEFDLADETPDAATVAGEIVKRAQSAGAASIDEIPLEDLEIGGPRAAQVLAAATAALRLNPGVETALSPSVVVRQVYNQLVDNPIYTSGNVAGKTPGPAVENLTKRGQRGVLASFIKDRNRLYREARKAGYAGRKRKFNEDVGIAGRRNDVDPQGNNFVTKAARSLREKIFDPYLRELKAAGILPEDFEISTALSYVTRIWNVRRLIAREDIFRKKVRDWLSGRIDEVQSAARRNKDEIDFISDADREQYMDEVATSIFNNLTGRGNGDVPAWIVPAKRGPLKGRTFRIQDELIEEFLEDDAELIARNYVRTVGADVEITKKFGRADMKDQLGDEGIIRKDYEALRKNTAADKKLTQKQRDAKLAKLDRSERRDIENLEAFRDLIRGTHRADEYATPWGQATRLALAWNYMRLLGGVVLSSAADLSRTLGNHGLRAVMGEALPILATNLRGLKISAKEAAELGAVTETILQSRLASLAELTDPYAYGNPVDRMVGNMTSTFTKATGLGYWNDGLKSINAVLTQNRIIRNSLVGDYSKLSKWERQYMAFLGISEDDARGIAQMYRKHGQKDGQVFIANTDKWGVADDLRAEGRAFDGLDAKTESRMAQLNDTIEHAEARIENLEATADSDDLLKVVKELREKTRAHEKQPKRPVLDILKSRGGVRVGSKLAGELRAMGITPKTVPGLFRKGRGLGDVDNIVLSEERVLADNFARHNGSEYANPNDILNAISDEMAGSPLRTSDERVLADSVTDLADQAKRGLDELGLPENASAKQIRQGAPGRTDKGKQIAAERESINKAKNEINALNEQLEKASISKPPGEDVSVRDVAPTDDLGNYLRDVYAAALNKDVDRTIVTKGVADQPLWTRSNTGKLIMQFKSFALASHQRVLIAGLQERPHRFMEMLTGATALGMMVSYLKFIERGNQEQADRLLDNPGLWIANGGDRTGLFAIPFDVSNTMDKVFRGNPLSITKGIQLAAGDEDVGGDVSRYASRNRLGAVLGPSAGILQDLGEIVSQLAEGEIKPSGVTAAIRQLPGATLPGVRSALHLGVKPALTEAVD